MIDLLTAPKIGELPDGPVLSRLRLTEVGPHIEGQGRGSGKRLLSVHYDFVEGRHSKKQEDKGHQQVIGYWWDDVEIQHHNHLVLDGKDFHSMTLEEYYNE